MSAREPLWYKDAVIYELRVGAFFDSNNDGIGDFRGLAAQLDYIKDLGVTTLWLLPFYPSPFRDDGYDVADYTRVHPNFGTIDDFKFFLRQAHRRDLRVITELIVNHTSDQHPWFQRARQAPPGSRWRNYYVWSDTREKYAEASIIFKDFEPSNWTWDSVAKAYYWHRFYAHQPDLNFAQEEVRRAVLRILDFWCRLGVDGFRLDAIPYLYEEDGTNCENLPQTHAFLKELRSHLDAKYPGRMLLAEANHWPEDAVTYFGQGDECHMAFHFPLMPRLFMALHMESRFPIVDSLKQTPEIPASSQWALFLRNHDELTLEMVTEEERDYMYRVYAGDAQARINLGIRRRLAPLLGNDRRRIELMNALLFSLPGTPVIYYGDEIGMGDNFFLGDRNGVRTPMQWNADRNAGFSRVNPQRLHLPVIIDPQYHYESVNVENQQSNPHSLLWWMKRLIALRKRFAAFGRGTTTFLSPRNSHVLAFVRCYNDERILVVANLSRFVQYAELDLAAYAGLHPVELFGRAAFPPIGEHAYPLSLGPHSFFWFTLEPQSRESHVAPLGDHRLPTWRVNQTWQNLLRGKQRDVLTAAACDWLRGPEGQSRGVRRAHILDVIPFSIDAADACLLLMQVDNADVSSDTYAVPLMFSAGEAAAHLRQSGAQALLAEVEVERPGGSVAGVIHDALYDSGFGKAVLEAIAQRRRFKGTAGEVAAVPMRAFAEVGHLLDTHPTATLPTVAATHSTVTYGNGLVLKMFRFLADGINPELELGRLLTERASFAPVPAVAGVLEYRAGRREPLTLGILQIVPENAGSAWRQTLDRLAHYYQQALATDPARQPAVAQEGSLLDWADTEPPATAVEMFGTFLAMARLIGERTAEFHLALASVPDDPAFAPEPFTSSQQRSTYESMRALTAAAFRQLRQYADHLDGGDASAEATRLLSLEDTLQQRFAAFVARRISATRIRCHGHYHLDQLLFTGKDFVIANLEGDPDRSIAERRRKRSPLRDVAAMLWSFAHAADTVLSETGAGGVLRHEDIAPLAPWARYWRTWVSAVFLGQYLRTANAAAFVPRTRDELHRLLDVLRLEHSMQELRAALQHQRPPALVIRGILRLVDAAA